MPERSLSLEIFCDDKRQAVLDSIRRYRIGCRQLFAVLGCAQAAGGEVIFGDGGVSIKPNNSQAQAILRQVFHLAEDAPAKALAYPCRSWFLRDLYPHCLSFVWDSARRQVVTRWQARDPEFTQAGRGWLVLQGSRGVAEFQRIGIEFPQATARPKLHKKTVILKWDRDIDAVEFSLGRMDPGRYFTWSKILSGEWRPGTVTLNEREGQLRLTVCYHRPAETADVDGERIMRLHVSTDGKLLILAGPDHEDTYDTIGLVDAGGMLERLLKQRLLWESRKECAGNPRRPWGNKKAWNATVAHLGRVTHNRERFAIDCNHGWTRRIATRAKAWRCGKVVFVRPEDLLGQPWGWYQFENFLRYKLDLFGSSLTIEGAAEEPEKPENTGAPALPEARPTDAG